jgi:hypothetical protein
LWDVAVEALLVALVCLTLSHYFGVAYIFSLIGLCTTGLIGYFITGGWPARRGEEERSDPSDYGSVSSLWVIVGIAFTLIGLAIMFPKLAAFGAN